MNLPLQMGAVSRGPRPHSSLRKADLSGSVLPARRCDNGTKPLQPPKWDQHAHKYDEYGCCKNGLDGDPKTVRCAKGK
jgi:hypothetical protein